LRKELTSGVDIDANPHQVWHMLTDFANYPAWNPFILHAEGSCEAGSTLRLRMQPHGGRAGTFTPVVREVVEQARLRWVGTFLGHRILQADHTFTITPLERGCRLVQHETFSGVVVPFFSASLDARTLPAFKAMNMALKAEVEGSAFPPSA
jgi:hypothetical protein